MNLLDQLFWPKFTKLRCLWSDRRSDLCQSAFWRAVHRDHAGDYADRLLHLPSFAA